MSTNFMASGSAKTQAGTTPFEQIALREQQEKSRAETEMAALDAEREEIQKAIVVKEQEAEEKLRHQATESLREYRDSDLAGMVSEAESAAKKESESLEQRFASREAAIVKELSDKIFAPDFLTAA